MLQRLDMDVFENPPNRSVILHQTDCRGEAVGAETKRILEKFPGWKEGYDAMCLDFSDRPSELLGEFYTYDAAPGLKICSVFGQDGIGREFRRTDYEAWKKALKTLVRQLEARAGAGDEWTVYVPSGTGCIEGGGDWHIMEDLLEYFAGGSSVRFVICRPAEMG